MDEHTEVTPTHTDKEATTAQIARAIRRRNLRLPALLCLEAGRPLALVGGQMVWASQPLLSLFIDDNRIAAVANLMEDPEALAMLQQQLRLEES